MTIWKKRCLITLGSLFLQILHWLIYQWTAFPVQMLLLTPLLLCAAYHVCQSDTIENRGISRRNVFFWGVLMPLFIAMLVSVICYVQSPSMALYHSSAEPIVGVVQMMALYAGRTVLTSMYLLIFAGLDGILLYLQDRRQEKKVQGGMS